MRSLKIKLVGTGFALVVLVGLLVAHPWQRPSGEMMQLRAIEQRLNLPAVASSADRREEDSGRTTDATGATHTSRYILRHYPSASNIAAAISSLHSQGWLQIEQATYGDTEIRYFTNKTNRTCASTMLEAKSSLTSPHSLYLTAASDEGCARYLKR